MQRTLKGEFKVLEIVQRETIAAVSSLGPAPKLNLGARHFRRTNGRRPDELFGPRPTSIAFARRRNARGNHAREERSFLDSNRRRSLATVGSDGSDARASRVSARKTVLRNTCRTLAGPLESERKERGPKRACDSREHKRRISQCLARRPQSTRLETRTKESNTCASIMARKIMMRNESEHGGGRLGVPRAIDRKRGSAPKAKQFRGTIGQSGSFPVPSARGGPDERSEFEHTR